MEKNTSDSMPSPNKMHRLYAENNFSSAQPKTMALDMEREPKVGTSPCKAFNSPKGSPEGKKPTAVGTLQKMDLSFSSTSNCKHIEGMKSFPEKAHHSPMHDSPYKAEGHRTMLVPIEAKKGSFNITEEVKPIPSPETSPRKRNPKLDSIPPLNKPLSARE